ncbi:hypothetical protein DM02DRAFT_673215 [Periconia macrospinosa]|uniref:Uncharacterized protein n=1 Tax=Periconia macrospinosa TaxID=97972 RepID=A0A2V1DLG2_9PLEO|nr:hypothetical protein DM02DRAFT_673215 [Periconia macrospinosa]
MIKMLTIFLLFTLIMSISGLSLPRSTSAVSLSGLNSTDAPANVDPTVDTPSNVDLNMDKPVSIDSVMATPVKIDPTMDNPNVELTTDTSYNVDPTAEEIVTTTEQICNGAVRIYPEPWWRMGAAKTCYTWGSGREIAGQLEHNATCVRFQPNFMKSFAMDVGRVEFPWQCIFYRNQDCTGYSDYAVAPRPNFGQDNGKFQTFKCFFRGGPFNPYW